MTLKIQNLASKDFKKIMNFAIEGMNLRDYVSNKIMLKAYSRYFLYLELEEASHVYAAYEGDEIVGLLLLNMKNSPKVYHNFWRKTYVRLINLIEKLFFYKKSNIYQSTNQKMLAEFSKHHQIDGELNFFAVNPQVTGKGIGTQLLEHVAKLHQGKQIYLYTDSGSTYQFYERRGFKQVGKEKITFNDSKVSKSLTCMLYSKVF